MDVNLTTKQIGMYAHIVSALEEQFCTFQDDIFYFTFGMENFIDGSGVNFDLKNNTIFIEDAAWSDAQLQKIYCIIGYARYYDFEVTISGSGAWMEKL